MHGAHVLSTESGVFTRGRGAEERTNRERFDRSGHGMMPQVRTDVGLHEPATLGSLITNAGFERTYSSLKPTWIPSDSAQTQQWRNELARRELAARLHKRIGQLKRLGVEEGLPWSSASEDDFWAFVSLWPNLSEPGLVLMDSGNLRVVWRNAVGEQVALEFRGYRQVYFVFFARRIEGPAMARSMGEDSVTRIGEKIAVENLAGLLRGRE